MKKILILAGILALTMSTQVFAAEEAASPQQSIPPKNGCNCPQKMHRPPERPNKAEFEKRLKLTEAQKEQAKQIHQKGFDEIKPVMDKIHQKRDELKAVMLSKISNEAQNEKINQLRKELGALKKEAHEIRMKNMKEFESILTKKQLTELNKMKEEGRKKFEKTHKNQGLKPSYMHSDIEGGPKPPME